MAVIRGGSRPYQGPVPQGYNTQLFRQTGQTVPLQQAPSGSGGGGGGQSQPQQQQVPQPQGGDYNLNESRAREEEANRRAIEAALGVYDQRATNLRSQIPILEQQRDLRLRGLDEGLAQFEQTADREQGTRVAEIGESRKNINEAFTQAGRQTRSAAQGLSKQLRRLFGGAGVLDSTAYRDANIESSRDFMRQLGDLGRDKSNRIATTEREEQDIKNFYAEQLMQTRQKVLLEKDSARADADASIKGILGDIDLNDREKIQAIEQKNAQLAERLSSLDAQEQQIKQRESEFARSLAADQAKLASKGSSSAYNTAKNTQQAITNANKFVTAYVANYSKLYGTNPSASQINTVLQNNGYPALFPEEDQFTQFGQLGQDEERQAGGSALLNNAFFQ